MQTCIDHLIKILEFKLSPLAEVTCKVVAFNKFGPYIYDQFLGSIECRYSSIIFSTYFSYLLSQPFSSFNFPGEEMTSQSIVALVLLVGICCLLNDANAFVASAWTSAHATFYGGSDASGTMGMYIFFLFLFFKKSIL